jgi:hypothetical protein
MWHLQQQPASAPPQLAPDRWCGALPSADCASAASPTCLDEQRELTPLDMMEVPPAW